MPPQATQADKQAANHAISQTDKQPAQPWLRLATLADVDALLALLNLCYRSDLGWTNESALVAGIRTTAAELTSILAQEGQYLFVYPNRCDRNRSDVNCNDMDNNDVNINDVNSNDPSGSGNQETGGLLGSILVGFCHTQAGDYASIGMFCVHPSIQGQGVGDTLLSAAQTFAQRHLASSSGARICMSVLSERPELLAYYQRRGYQLTGVSEPFPDDGNNGTPKRDDLCLLELAKPIA